MPTRTIHPAEDSLTRRLVALGVGSARATVQEALRIGFTPEAVAAILEWFEGQGRTDLKGQVWYPYSPQQLVWRLRDADARDAKPEHGNWKGGKCAIWGSLDPDPPARTPKGKDDIRAGPTPHSRFFDGLDREKCRTLVQRLAQSPDPLGLRCRKLVDLFDAAWPIGYLTVPPAIRKLLTLFPLERLRS